MKILKRDISTKIKVYRSGIIFCIFIFCIMNFLTGCQKKKIEPEKTSIPVEASLAKLCLLQEKLFYVGDIKAFDQIMVYPKVTGKLLTNTVKENDRVTKDQTLALIDRDEIGFKYKPSPVLSPIAGVVGRVYPDKGETVSPSVPIAEILNMDTVKVKVNVGERDLPKIKESQICQVKIDAYPDETFEGKVITVSPVVDTSSRTALIELEIPNQDYRLKPGMFARIWIIVKEQPSVLCISRDAVLREDSSTFAMVADKNNKIHKRKITLGIAENNKLEVLEGLTENEVVITLGKERLKTGDVVKIIGEPTEVE